MDQLEGKEQLVHEGLRVAGLFAGIGGLEIGLGRAGHCTHFLCEIDPGAREILQEKFPDVDLVDDIRELRGLPKETELLAAGFPCQDLSQAGGTRGIKGEQSGLIEHVFRLLKAQHVPWVLLENVPFMLQLKRGSAMRFIVSGLEDLGYRWAYRVVDTRAFGLPQRRERVFLLASSEVDPSRLLFQQDAGVRYPASHKGYACGFYWTEGNRGLGWAVNSVPTLKGGSSVGIPSPPAIWMPDGRIATPEIRDAERLQGFEPDWTLQAGRAVRSSYRWKLVGNAVTVDVAHWLGRLILGPEGGRPEKVTPLGAKSRWPKAAFGARGERYAVEVSSWPVHIQGVPLPQFLKYPVKLLSEKATAGFMGRLQASTLWHPPEFMADLKRHLQAVSDLQSEGNRVSPVEDENKIALLVS